VVNNSPLITAEAKRRKRAGASSWRVVETYVKVKGKWVYWYRAIDKHDDTLDFMLSEHRDEAPATAFFKQAIDNNGLPHKVVMDKSGANYAGLENINLLMLLASWVGFFIEICQVKYLNNIIEQDHRFIKKITKPMMGFKAFHSAQATLGGIERHT
jgi:putative transposase